MFMDEWKVNEMNKHNPSGESWLQKVSDNHFAFNQAYRIFILNGEGVLKEGRGPGGGGRTYRENNINNHISSLFLLSIMENSIYFKGEKKPA